MNYYKKIKNKLINNEVYKKVKDYSKNRSDLNTYYKVGKLLNDAGKSYGEGIIKKYSMKLEIDLGKKYNERTLRRFRQFYNLFNKQKWSPLATKLLWSHYVELLKVDDINKINYYIRISETQNLSYRKLRDRIKSREYERKRRLDEIPQTAQGKTIMTIEPKFVPSNAATIAIDDFTANIRLIDCVGYVIDAAKGYEDDNGPRMVRTPWVKLAK